LHPDLNLKAIKKSLEIYGQRKPIVVNKNRGFIEAGNGLFAAAKALGWKEIAVVFVNDDKDTE
jgi:ParB-like nuclease domain.